jgi:hypothetical protein
MGNTAVRFVDGTVDSVKEDPETLLREAGEAGEDGGGSGCAD